MADTLDREAILGYLARAGADTELLEELKALANDILVSALDNGERIDHTRGPITGLVSLQARDPISRTRFLPGDVLCTEAGVELNGTPGWGMCLGEDRSAALALALCDAETARQGAYAHRVAALATRCREALKNRRSAEFEDLRPSIVEFEEIM